MQMNEFLSSTRFPSRKYILQIEACADLFSLKLSIRRMDFGVSLQITAVNECCRAHITFVRPRTGMNTFMNKQFAGTSEPFATITA